MSQFQRLEPLKANTLSREELFALVWEHSSTKVARELGISDTALGKLCRRLQVPKPPRGYWGRVASGKTPRQPPLPAYRAEIEQQQRKKLSSIGHIQLSKLQLEFLRFGLDELASAGVDTNGCELAYDGIRTVSPELTAQILILLQNRYEKFLADRTSARSMNAAMSSLSNLVDKLQPYAQEQILIFHRQSDGRYSRSTGPTLLVRASHDFLARMKQLSLLARDNGLDYVAADLSVMDYTFSVHQIASPNAYHNASTELCVSVSEVWVRTEVQDTWSHELFDTIHVPLREIGPIDLVPPSTRRLPVKILRSAIKPYSGHLQALQEAQAIFDALISAAYDVDRTIPDERLALFDRLWFSRGETDPFIAARQAWRQIEVELERWEQELEREAMTLCQDVMGIEEGDIVVVESGGKPLRLTLEGMTVFTSESDLTFSLWGKRFRKDGLPGKRSEHFTIVVENDLDPK